MEVCMVCYDARVRWAVRAVVGSAARVAVLGGLIGCGRGSSPPSRNSDDWSSSTPAPAAAPAEGQAAEPAPTSEAGLAPESSPHPEEDPSFEGTAGVTQKTRPGANTAILKDVRTGEHASYDRVVFEFAASALPGYHVEYVDKPVRECKSGKVREVSGDARLRVRLEPAQPEPRGKSKGRKVKLKVVREIEPMCVAEGRVEWVIGAAASKPYRVLELSDPPRLVVDLLHDAHASSDSGKAGAASENASPSQASGAGNPSKAQSDDQGKKTKGASKKKQGSASAPKPAPNHSGSPSPDVSPPP
jgi:hypothetical protein